MGARYIDPAFKAQAPRGWPGPENPSVLEVAGKVMPRIAATPRAHCQTMYARKADRYRRASERNFDPISQLEAIDTEGIVSVDCDEEPAKYAVDWLQEGNIVFSTDYPHADAKYPEASARFLKLPLADSAKRRIMWDNCVRLYGIV